MKKITVSANDAGQRLDRFLLKTFSKLPSSMMYKQIRKKNIKVNHKRCTPAQTVEQGDVIELYLNDEVLAEKPKHYDFLQAPKMPDILYEDDNIVLIEKPQGQLCHPDGKEYVNTVVSSLKRYLYEKGAWNPEDDNSFSPALANRIDRNTGGIVIGVKNAQALRILAEKIKNREIEKYYLTIAEGRFDKPDDTLHGYLVKNEKKNMVSVRATPCDGAKEIATRYRVLDYKNGYSLLEIELLTGRAHQIRAHLAAVGHPLLGDGKYGSKHGRFQQELYSYKLVFSFSTDADVLNYLNGRIFEAAHCPIKERFYDGK